MDETCPIEAVNLINALETAYGAPIGLQQQNALCGLFRRLKGQLTTNGSNVLDLINDGNARMWLHTPQDDSTATAAGYNIEALTATSLGTFNNFVSGDFTPNGVQPDGASKYFDSGLAPASLPSSFNMNGFYSRTNNINAGIDFGTWNATNVQSTYMQTRTTPDRLIYRHHSSLSIIVNSVGTSDGFILLARSPANQTFSEFDGVQENIDALLNTGDSNFSMYFHGNNRNGTAGNFSDRQLCMYFTGLPFISITARADFYQAILWYQQNVITGGRDV